MTLLGLDFDNTLVTYDELFFNIALERELIKDGIYRTKKELRDYLRFQNQEDSFTLLQAEVYGARILEAKPADGMLSALKELAKKDIQMVIVSHKTKKPLMGPDYNLHDAALKWLDQNGFFSKQGLNWDYTKVNFETTKEKKIRKIHKLRCTHFIDDLPEILKMINPSVRRILYDPNNEVTSKFWEKLPSWGQANKLFHE